MLTCVVGLAWGDEGKGKIVDYLSSKNDICVRYNGGANAGHTIHFNGLKHKRHLLPSGSVMGLDCILADGMVIDPIRLVDEIKEAKNHNDFNLYISKKAHCVMPWHIQDDIQYQKSLGSTGRGIGPCYAEKANRQNAIRMGELLSYLTDRSNNDIHPYFELDSRINESRVLEKYIYAANYLQEYICDTGKILRKSIKENKNIIFESANAILLDIDHGTFPYVTSSPVGPAAIPQSCGLPNIQIDRIIGVIKCHQTRVGTGPFPSEIENEHIAKFIRAKGNEFGTTTGRPRRIGWLDLDILKESVEISGCTEIALMHCDTLSNMGNVSVFYDSEFHEMNSWSNLNDDGFKNFISVIEERLQVPVNLVSYGTDRNQMVNIKVDNSDIEIDSQNKVLV